MIKQKILIFFGAHPDDETFGIGSTLAHYVLKGVKVYYVCSTRGEVGTVDPEFMKGHSNIAEVRTSEMECAGKELGLTGIYYLEFRDSGMPGAADNKHPNALAAAPMEQVVVKMVKIIRDLKPDVVITHDAGGSYGHPDHIATHNATVKAFYAAGDTGQYAELGPAFQPSKLYFGVRSHGSMRIMIKLMPLFGQDPHHFGRNRDIDMTKTLDTEYPHHAVVRYNKKAREIQAKAAACHVSQGGGMPRRGPFIMRLMQMFRRRQDYFMRDYPKPGKHIEKDLFEGIN